MDYFELRAKLASGAGHIHRSKNMLSVVSAIAHQMTANDRDDFVRRFSQRIQALAASHDLLAGNEWKSVAIVDLIRAQLDHFADLLERSVAQLWWRLLPRMLGGVVTNSVGISCS